MASYCEVHVELHNTLHGVKRHRLVEARKNLQERACSHHGKLLEVFCRTDQQYICHLCITDSHRTHDVISIQLQVEEKKSEIGNLRSVITDRIKSRLNELQELQQAVDEFKMSAGNAIEQNDKMLIELVHSMEKKKCRVKELIKAQEEEVIQKANEVLHSMQEELFQLKKRDTFLQNMERLSQEQNGIHFIQNASSAFQLALPESRDAVFFVHPYCSFELSTQAVSNLIKQLNTIYQSCLTTISDQVKKAIILSSPVPKTQEDFLPYASELTLNLNTAHVTLRLSEENRKVTAVPLMEDYTEHPDRFDSRVQILCNEALEGSPQYWEVKYGGECWVCVAVSYSKIQRKGKWGPLFGRNRDSWGLRCHSNSFSFWHNNKCTPVKHKHPCSRIGVYLDHRAGLLAFYNVSDNMSLIHEVQTSFCEPVYAGFGLAGKGTWIKLCDKHQGDLNKEETHFVVKWCT
ncbi:tripartite motif-containing protein 16-like [Hoplias malabaricus]|uniref:tripartite motif-containing protein 16-like n=1 Tax=Hoplias malabaricus TaxID=27720 RepID=UPI0034618611